MLTSHELKHPEVYFLINYDDREYGSYATMFMRVGICRKSARNIGSSTCPSTVCWRRTPKRASFRTGRLSARLNS